MFLSKWLTKLQMDEQDIAEILMMDERYGAHVALLAAGYMNAGRTFSAYTDAEYKAEKAVAMAWLDKARQPAQSEGEDYLLQLLFWLHCIPYLEEVYRDLGISEDVLVNSMMDLTYKTRECRKKFGCCGVTTQRYYLFCRVGMFGLGRLQFNPLVYAKEPYQFGDYALNPGDRVYGCHIPSSGKLTPELCMESLDRAYHFFKHELRGNILPVRCSSWLLYPPYAEKVFPEGSNLKAFSRLFDVKSSTASPEDPYVLQTVFGRTDLAALDSFPQETGLQKNLAAYLKAGGDFGSGYGILLYDGVKKEIINKNNQR